MIELNAPTHILPVIPVCWGIAHAASLKVEIFVLQATPAGSPHLQVEQPRVSFMVAYRTVLLRYPGGHGSSPLRATHTDENGAIGLARQRSEPAQPWWNVAPPQSRAELSGMGGGTSVVGFGAQGAVTVGVKTAEAAACLAVKGVQVFGVGTTSLATGGPQLCRQMTPSGPQSMVGSPHLQEHFAGAAETLSVRSSARSG